MDSYSACLDHNGVWLQFSKTKFGLGFDPCWAVSMHWDAATQIYPDLNLSVSLVEYHFLYSIEYLVNELSCPNSPDFEF